MNNRENKGSKEPEVLQSGNIFYPLYIIIIYPRQIKYLWQFLNISFLVSSFFLKLKLHWHNYISELAKVRQWHHVKWISLITMFFSPDSKSQVHCASSNNIHWVVADTLNSKQSQKSDVGWFSSFMALRRHMYDLGGRSCIIFLLSLVSPEN
jgi:hypothetical protein